MMKDTVGALPPLLAMPLVLLLRHLLLPLNPNPTKMKYVLLYRTLFSNRILTHYLPLAECHQPFPEEVEEG